MPRVQGGNGPPEQPAKVWLAYWEDFSEFAVFADELACLRYAVDHSPMAVAHIELGRAVREQLREQYAARRTKGPDG